jgi:virulence factor Mce-like protein
MKLPIANERIASKQRSKAFMITLGLFGMAIFVGFAYIGFEAPNAIPGRSYYNLYAQFHNADNLTYHYQVRVDGDIVGQVLNPTVKNGIATVQLQLNPSVQPLKSDTTIEILPRSAVGIRYVEITPGLNGTPLKNGATIPASHTSATTQLDTVLATFDASTRANMRSFLRNFGEGLAGQGQNLNDTLQGAPSFLRNGTAVLGAIANRPGAMASMIRGGATLATASDPVRQTIATGFQPEADALQPFADSSSDVQATLAQAPPAMNAMQSDLPSFDALAAQLAGFANGIRPGLQAGPAAFSQTSAMLSEARPALDNATKVLDTAGAAVNPALDLLTSVRPVLTPLRGGLTSSIPIVSDLGAHGCDFVNFGRFWGSGMQYGNADGNVLRFQVSSPDVGSLYGATKVSATTFSDPYPAPCQAGHEALP